MWLPLIFFMPIDLCLLGRLLVVMVLFKKRGNQIVFAPV